MLLLQPGAEHCPTSIAHVNGLREAANSYLGIWASAAMNKRVWAFLVQPPLIGITPFSYKDSEKISFRFLLVKGMRELIKSATSVIKGVQPNILSFVINVLE